MSKSRIWDVIAEAAHDEGNDYTRAVFDNEEAARAFVENFNRLEYQLYIDDRNDDRWSKVQTKPPSPVSYERWIVSDFTKMLDRGIVLTHLYDLSHEPTKMHVEPGWLHGSTPELTTLFGIIMTTDEAEDHRARLEAAQAPLSRRAMRRARREAKERDAAGT